MGIRRLLIAVLAFCLGPCFAVATDESPAREDVLGRVCFWVDPARAADFTHVFDSRLRPHLESKGLEVLEASGRPTRPGVYARLLRADRPADLLTARRHLEQDPNWRDSLSELASAFGTSPAPPSLRYEVSPYLVSAAVGKTVRAGPGTLTWPAMGIGHWRTYDITDGLLDDDVLAICQDRHGYMWFGTWSGGVSRFDGTDWVTLTQADGLASNWVWSVYEDRDGAMWFGTRAGVTRYDGEEMKTFLPSDDVGSNGVWSILQDAEDGLWFGTRDGLYLFDGHAWSRYSTEQGLAGNSIQAAFGDETGDLWFATEGGVSRFDGESFQTFTVREGLLHNRVRAIGQSTDGAMWFSTALGISRFDGSEWSHITSEDGLAANGAGPLLVEGDGCLWAGTGRGVSHFDGTDWHDLTIDDGLTNNHVRTIFRDREGYLWFGTEGGVSQYDCHEFVTFTEKEGLAGDAVEWIYEDLAGSVWLGTNGGLCRVRGDSLTTFTRNDGLPGGTVSGIVEGRPGEIWLATSRGAAVYDGRRFRHFDTSSGLAGDGLYVVYQDGSGAMWFGTSGSGITRYNGVSMETFTEADGLASNTVRTIVQDASGAMWFGCFVKGVSRYDGTSFRTYTTDDGLASNWGRYIHQDRGGRIWVAAGGGGVNLLKGDAFESFTTENGFINNWGRAIQEGKDGHLWFGTGGGVARYNGRHFQKLTRSDGLASNQVRSMRMDSKDNLWVGTINGVTRFRPPTSHPPPVHVRFVIADQRYTEPTELSISSDIGMLAFEFGSISYKTLPNQMVYLYRLRGLNDQWHSTNSSRIEYEHLTPGNYTFEVAAIDRDLTRSEGSAIVQVSIHHPYYKIWLVACLAAAMLVIAWQTLRILRRDRMLGSANVRLRKEISDREQAEAEREKLDTQLREMQYLYRLRSSLSAAKTVDEIVDVAAQSVMEAMSATSSGGNASVEHDGRRWQYGNGEPDGRLRYVRPLAWGDRERGKLELQSSVELTESQERALLDETAGQMASVLEARELEMELLQSGRLVSLGQMAAGVAHELNQPLSAISMTAGDIVSRMTEGIELPDDELKDMMGDVRKLVDHMSGTVNHLRTFSRDSSGETRIPFSLNDTVRSALRLSRAQLQEHDIDLALDLQDEVPELIGNSNQVEQVILNLIRNAVDALDERDGGEAKRIEVRTSTHDGQAILEMEDNGVGLDEAYRLRVFEPFFTTKTADRGTGLGLAISYAIVKRHGGEITCTSTKGSGSTFRLALPVRSSDSREAT